MRRGLMAWDENELPRGTLVERIAGLRTMMQRERLDAFICYTNLVQPGEMPIGAPLNDETRFPLVLGRAVDA